MSRCNAGRRERLKFDILLIILSIVIYLSSHLTDLLFGHKQVLIDKETKNQWMLDEAKGYENKRQWQEAIQVYQALLKKDPSHWEARIRLAGLYERHLKDLPKAQEKYQRIIKSALSESIWHRRAREALHIIQKDSE